MSFLPCCLMALFYQSMLLAGFLDWLRVNPLSVLKLLGCRSISVASLITQSMWLAIVTNTFVFLKLIWWPSLMLCLAIADLSGCKVYMSCMLFTPCFDGEAICSKNLATFTRNAVYAWYFEIECFFHWSYQACIILGWNVHSSYVES